MARGQQLGASVSAAQSTVKSAAASSATSGPATTSSGAAILPQSQARWSLLLDADMRDLVGGGSFSVKLAAIAVTYNVCVWSSDCSAHDSAGVEIIVKGEACSVAAAKLEVTDALVAACCFPIQPSAAVQVKEPPSPMQDVAYQSPAYVDWSQAGTLWAPWTIPAAAPYPLPSGLVTTPYADFSSYGMTSPDMMFTGFQSVGSAADMQVVHFTQQIPHSLVGLVIGVKGASIHAVEVASQCHLSLDRGCVFTDPGDSVPYVLLHIHGQRCGAMQAIAMVAQILQRHVHAMQNPPPTCLAIDSAPEHSELPDPHHEADIETTRQDITRALFAEPAERCVSPPLPPLPATKAATPLPMPPLGFTSLSSPQLAPATPASFLRQPSRRRRLSAPSPADAQQFTPLFTPPQR